MKKIFLALLYCAPLFLQAQIVGINTLTPFRGKLEVKGGVDKSVAIFGGESTGISLQKGTPAIGFNQYFNGGSRYIGNGYAGVQYVDQANGAMIIDLFGNGTANSPCPLPTRALTLTASGRACIGLNNYNASLSVDRNPGVEATAFFFGSTHHSTFNYGPSQHTYIRAGQDNATVFINDIPNAKTILTGPVGINTSTPAYPLEIRQLPNAGLMMVEPVGFTRWEMVVSSFNGNLHLRHNNLPRGQFSAVNGNYSSVSDRRLKTDIKPLTHVLENIIRLEPVVYEMKHNNPGREETIGLVAQDLKPLFPQLVHVMNDSTLGYKGINDLHTVNYNGLAVVAVKAVQEQQEAISMQSKRLKELEARLDRLNQ